MTKVKLNLVSGNIQEREVDTAFKYNDVKYIIFDGESTGSMGLPIILVCKEVLGKVVGITDAEEWKNTKECLKKIISGEKIEYASVNSELKADDIYYRQLTLPVASFDALKNSYVIPDTSEVGSDASNATPVFEQIVPEDITKTDISSINPVPADTFNNPQLNNEPAVTSEPVPSSIPAVEQTVPVVEKPVEEYNLNEASSNVAPAINNYEELKNEFLKSAEKLFDEIYNKINHND